MVWQLTGKIMAVTVMAAAGRSPLPTRRIPIGRETDMELGILLIRNIHMWMGTR